MNRDIRHDAMRDTRVLHIINTLDRGGAESNLARLCAATARVGIQNSVIALRNDGALHDSIAQHARVLSTWDAIAAGVGHTPRPPPDIVVGWMYAGCVAASLIGPRGTPLVWNFRHVPDDLALESSTTRTSLRLLRRFCARPSRKTPCLLIANSDAARSAHENLGVVGCYRVIGNGVDTDFFSPDNAQRSAIRTELGFADADCVLLQVGRFHPHKGHRVLLDAIFELMRTRTNVRLLLLGAGVTSIRHAIFDAPECGGRVHRYGERDDVVRFYRAADGLVSPSLTESFPTVVLEAMSCALPCIATDVGATRTIVADTGDVVPAGSVAALRTSIERFVSTSQDSRRRAGVAARTRIVNGYSIGRMADAFVEVYDSLGARARS